MFRCHQQGHPAPTWPGWQPRENINQQEASLGICPWEGVLTRWLLGLTAGKAWSPVGIARCVCWGQRIAAGREGATGCVLIWFGTK